MYKQLIKEQYHIFSNEVDEWTITLQEAVKIARFWARKYNCVRIYKETN